MDELAVVLGDFGNDIVLEVEVIVEGGEVGPGVAGVVGDQCVMLRRGRSPPGWDLKKRESVEL